ncbi:hypothetical protein PAXRUDRAFT_154889 [Paxillus rubicundulus Ve08.2h10]|uniref:Uncharacterized protein n=1 Tax=Paxillus rubicundulus Ve08.2h10 TaxID=930991 RepID=A0A0D0DCM5_9AGAM|nr:hypothetical protein PAXRUDRAFT_154889 [Paxillus rubicundulus Ve08.2h10]
MRGSINHASPALSLSYPSLLPSIPPCRSPQTSPRTLPKGKSKEIAISQPATLWSDEDVTRQCHGLQKPTWVLGMGTCGVWVWVETQGTHTHTHTHGMGICQKCIALEYKSRCNYTAVKLNL